MLRRRRIPYDRLITVFSPDGRLLQVEYALETVKRGSTVLGIACPGGVVLAAEVGPSARLQDPDFSRKVFKVDEHVGAVVSGLVSDARVLIDRARVYAQSNRLMYDEPVDVKVLSERVGNIQQLCTQRSWIRPFGVSVIFGGVDKTGPRVFKTDPSGTCWGYKAVSIGAGSETVTKILEGGYKDNITLEEAKSLAVKCLSKVIEEELEAERIRIVVVPAETKRFRELTNAEIAQYMNGGNR
ncbi:MAG: archaeal proteasome endopeptidase complex subunit alpha [Candidatus Bathyarchaeia archaeon]